MPKRVLGSDTNSIHLSPALTAPRVGKNLSGSICLSNVGTDFDTNFAESSRSQYPLTLLGWSDWVGFLKDFENYQVGCG